MKKVFFAFFVSLTLLLAGCASMNKTQMGTGAGAAAGAAIGGLVAKNSVVGALLGAAIGGTAGYFIGNHMDKQAEELKQAIPEAEVERVGEGINLTFESGLLFQRASAILSAEAKETLTAFASVVAKDDYDDTHILIEGHTSDNGDPNNDQANMDLSKQRAESVASYLVAQGVARDRLEIQYYGETQPKYPNDTEENMAKNRRVEFAIYANDDLKEAAKDGKLPEDK